MQRGPLSSHIQEVKDFRRRPTSFAFRAKHGERWGTHPSEDWFHTPLAVLYGLWNDKRLEALASPGWGQTARWSQNCDRIATGKAILRPVVTAFVTSFVTGVWYTVIATGKSGEYLSYRRFEMRRIKFLLMFMMLTLLLGINAVPGRGARAGTVIEPSRWLTYTDPRFDFSIQYPADWYVIPRDDSDPTAMSGVVTFASVDPATIKAGEPEFVVGHYLAEFQPDMSLSAWTDAYEAVSNGPKGYEIHERVSRIIGDKAALSVKGESGLLEYQFTNVPNGKVVWFIWTNIGDSAGAEAKAIYERAVTSFKLGTQSPRSLQTIYGENFRPQPLEPRIPNSASKLPNPKAPGLAAPLATIGLPSPASAWYAPIESGPEYRVWCGSIEHVDDPPHKYSKYAADIQMRLRPVKSARTSWVDFAGWANGGWGNLVEASTDHLFPRVYTMHYAHLETISVYPGQKVGTRSHIGTSGNTGVKPPPGSEGFHLHFHIRSGTDSVNLTGMTGFYPDSDYPDNFADCGYVQL